MYPFAPGYARTPAWQRGLELVVAALFALGICSPLHPGLTWPTVLGFITCLDLGLGGIGLCTLRSLERSGWMEGVKLLFFALSHLLLLSPFLPPNPLSPRQPAFTQGPPRPGESTSLVLCVRILAGSLVSVQTSSGRCYMRLLGALSQAVGEGP